MYGGGIAGHLGRHLELSRAALQFGRAFRYALLQFIGVVLHLLAQTCLPNCDCELVGHFAGDIHVFGSNTAMFLYTQIECTDQVAVGDERYVDVGTYARSL